MTDPRPVHSPPPIGRRIRVCGTTASGKSTLGKALADAIGVPFVELDAFHHMPGWQERPDEDFRRLVSEAVAGDGWVVDGNYQKAADIISPRADTIIWLDYPLPVILARLTRRTFARWWRRELLWGTNRERLWRHFLVPRDSLYWWVLTTHRRRRRQSDEALRPELNPGKVLLRLRSPAEADRLLEQVRRGSTSMA
jgi:adenylate kinase family enzyme